MSVRIRGVAAGLSPRAEGTGARSIIRTGAVLLCNIWNLNPREPTLLLASLTLLIVDHLRFGNYCVDT